jgi:hypothetical protein
LLEQSRRPGAAAAGAATQRRLQVNSIRPPPQSTSASGPRAPPGPPPPHAPAPLPPLWPSPAGGLKELCADPAAAAWVLKELLAVAKADKLKGFERVAAVSAARACACARRPRAR